MAKYIKGTIAYQPIVEQVNRKFVPRDQTCSSPVKAGPVTVQSQGWMGGMTRTTGRAGIGTVSKNSLVIRTNGRVTQPSANELFARQLFAQVKKANDANWLNMQQVDTMTRMFIAAKDDKSKTINGVSTYGFTMKGWTFAVQYAGKKADSEYDLNIFPDEFDE